MSHTPEEAVYIILVQGHLDPRRAQHFAEMQFKLHPDGCSELRGRIVDRAALCGLLNYLCGLGVHLLRVERVENLPDVEIEEEI